MKLFFCYRFYGLLIVILSLATGPLYAQSQASSGVIEGTIRTEDGTAMAGVSMTVRNKDNGFERRVQSDMSGRYRSALLALGNYEVLAERSGFSPTLQSGIVLGIAQTLTVNFTLGQSTSSELVNLVVRQSLVEPERKLPSTNINARFVENLPVHGRKFLDLGVMVPGATEFGDRDTSATADFAGVNHFYSAAIVDGVDSYQAWSNLPKGKFLVPFEFSQSAVREFQVSSGNLTAEFGRTGGGLVSVVTKSGTNAWHGDISYFLADSRMSATPRFALSKPKTRQQQFGGSLGGPISANKLFVFGNYDQQLRSEPMIVTAGTVLDGFDTTLSSITTPAEQQRFVQARDLVRSLTGNFDRDIDQYTFLIRTDWHVNAAHIVSARLNHQNLHATNVPENGFTTPIVSGMAVSNNGTVKVNNSSLALQWTAAFSPAFLNEARLQFAPGTERQTPNGQGPQVRIGSGRTGIAFGRRDVFPSDLDETRWQWLDNVTVIRGAHEIKTGFDFHHISDRSFSLTAMDGSYQFNNLRDFANGRFTSYTQGFGVPEDTTTSPYYSLFVQDNVKLASSLTMNAGLRYEFQDLDQPSVPNPQFPSTARIPEDKNNLAPRLSFAWQPKDRFVVRGSYGIYYGPLPIQVNAVAKTQNGVLQNVREYRGAAAAGIQYPAVFPQDPNPQVPTPGARIVVFSPDFVAPYVQQVNLELEREITADLSVSTGWLYTKGTRLRSNEDINLFPPGSRVFEIRDSARNISGLFSLPSFGGPASRPFAFFDQIAEFRSDNNSVYHAYFVQANKSYSRGLQFLANYTFSKLIDRGQAPGNQITCCTSENTFNPGDERGLGRRDQRHRANIAAVWDLPTAFAGAPLLEKIFGGWRANTIIKAGSGRPITPTVTGDSGGDVNGNAVRGGDRAPFFGPSAFTGPGYANVDLALRKLFSSEGRSLDLGVEAFNLFNHANYLRPAPEYFSLTNVQGGISRIEGPLPSFGKPQDATRSRELQFVIRFYF